MLKGRLKGTCLVSNWLYFKKFNVYSFFTHAIFAIVAHHFKGEFYNESILSILEELLRKICLFHVIEMEKQVFRIYIW